MPRAAKPITSHTYVRYRYCGQRPEIDKLIMFMLAHRWAFEVEYHIDEYVLRCSVAPAQLKSLPGLKMTQLEG